MDDDMQKSDIIYIGDLEKNILEKEKSEELKSLKEYVENQKEDHERYKGASQSFGAAVFIGSLTYLAIKAALGYELTEDDRTGVPAIACITPGILYICRFITWLERRSAEKELGKYLSEHPECRQTEKKTT